MQPAERLHLWGARLLLHTSRSLETTEAEDTRLATATSESGGEEALGGERDDDLMIM